MKPDSQKAMQRLALVMLLLVSSHLPGCVTGGISDPLASSNQEGVDGYCHLKLEPVGPTDVARPTQSRAGDFIDYSGPCAGPSPAEQIRKQKRYEAFRFGRDFMPG